MAFCKWTTDYLFTSDCQLIFAIFYVPLRQHIRRAKTWNKGIRLLEGSLLWRGLKITLHSFIWMSVPIHDLNFSLNWLDCVIDACLIIYVNPRHAVQVLKWFFFSEKSIVISHSLRKTQLKTLSTEFIIEIAHPRTFTFSKITVLTP